MQVLSVIGLPKLPSAPLSPVEAQEYYDTTLKKIGFYDGTGWVYGSSSSSKPFAFFAS